MTLTADGARLLQKAERTLEAHRALMDEAARTRGHLDGRLRIGASGAADHEAIGRLLVTMAERWPDVAITLEHASSAEIVSRIRTGALDAGFVHETSEPDVALSTLDVARFGVWIAAPVGTITDPVAWSTLAERPWIYPPASACCGRVAEALFARHRFRPERVITVDRQALTRTLVASGMGIGLLHTHEALAARERGEAVLLAEWPTPVRVLFAWAARRDDDAVLRAAIAVLKETPLTTPPAEPTQ